MPYFVNKRLKLITKYLGQSKSIAVDFVLTNDGSLALSKEDYEGIINNKMKTDVKVTLPKMKIDFTSSLKDTFMRHLQMRRAFTSGLADFSGMGKGKLWISDVVHKTALEMNEMGLKAAAATVVIMALESTLQPGALHEFKADRPFIMIIRDTKTNAPLFIGNVSNPEELK